MNLICIARKGFNCWVREFGWVWSKRSCVKCLMAQGNVLEQVTLLGLQRLDLYCEVNELFPLNLHYKCPHTLNKDALTSNDTWTTRHSQVYPKITFQSWAISKRPFRPRIFCSICVVVTECCIILVILFKVRCVLSSVRIRISPKLII